MGTTEKKPGVKEDIRDKKIKERRRRTKKNEREFGERTKKVGT